MGTLTNEEAAHAEEQPLTSVIDIDGLKSTAYALPDEVATMRRPTSPGSEPLFAKVSNFQRRLESLTFSPDGVFRSLWDFVAVVLLVYLAIAVPLELGFDTGLGGSDFGRHADDFVLVFFLADIAVQFNTAYIIESTDTVVCRHRLIARRYLKGWFLVDVFSSFPYALLFRDSGSSVQAPRILRLVRIARLLKLAKADALLAVVEEHLPASYTRPTMLLIKLLFGMFVVLGHWLACVWHGVGVATGQTMPDDALQMCHGGSELQSCRWLDLHFPGEGVRAPFWDRYVASLYFTLGSMSTLGSSISPVNATEELVAIAFAMVSAAAFSTLCSSLSGSVISDQMIQWESSHKVNLILRYMRRRKLPIGLQNRVQQYVKHTMEHEAQTTLGSELATLLSSPLQAELTSCVRGGILRSAAYIFSRSPDRFLRAVVQHCETQLFAVGDFLVEEGDSATAMICIVSGHAVAFQQTPPALSRKGGAHVKGMSRLMGLFHSQMSESNERSHSSGGPRFLYLGSGACLGQTSLFAHTCSRWRANVQFVESHGEVLKLERLRFQHFMRNEADGPITEQFEEVCDAVEDGNLFVLGLACRHCGRVHEPAPSCPSAAAAILRATTGWPGPRCLGEVRTLEHTPSFLFSRGARPESRHADDSGDTGFGHLWPWELESRHGDHSTSSRRPSDATPKNKPTSLEGMMLRTGSHSDAPTFGASRHLTGDDAAFEMAALQVMTSSGLASDDAASPPTVPFPTHVTDPIPRPGQRKSQPPAGFAMDNYREV